MQNHRKHPKLFEGLRAGDLKRTVSHRFTVDRYKSKMGEDEDVIVLAFTVTDKYPAIDLMEFIEKGYPSVLDADTSAGEEADGNFHVFVEFNRSEKAPKEISSMLKGIGQLCDCDEWHFKYFKDIEGHDFTEEAFAQFVPLTAEGYKDRIKSQTIDEVEDILDQGAAEVADLDENNNLTFKKPFAGDLTVKLENIGDFNSLQESLQGPIQLDESSVHQVAFLEKYLGNYQIHKINDKFLINNKDRALIISKGQW